MDAAKQALLIDAKLVERLRGGESAAFDIVYDAYRGQLFGFLVRMCRERRVAEDLLQETWLRLARSSSRLRPDTNLRAYLFTIARNLYRSHRRWAALDAVRLEELEGLQPRRQVLTPHENAAASEERERIEVALTRLSHRHREVIVLVGLMAMSPTEAASVLGESPAATRKRLSRARTMLKEELKP